MSPAHPYLVFQNENHLICAKFMLVCSDIHFVCADLIIKFRYGGLVTHGAPTKMLSFGTETS